MRSLAALNLQILLILLVSLVAAAVHRQQVKMPPEIVLTSDASESSRDIADSVSADDGGDDVIQIGTVTVDQAYTYFQEGAQFVDARNEEKYIEGHVEGAWLVPFAVFGSGYPEVLDYLDPSQVTVIYCEGGDCDASKLVAKQLLLHEFIALKILTAGFPAWAEAGNPVETGIAE